MESFVCGQLRDTEHNVVGMPIDALATQVCTLQDPIPRVYKNMVWHTGTVMWLPFKKYLYDLFLRDTCGLVVDFTSL